ncbi:hypothetical protein BGX28_004985 [Mortierella sp. GBA30]|nr:hypothetical protein BGX28_004985 [Mortierella sp. GBA30]
MQFRAGIKLIQQAYEEQYQVLVEEVNTWKWISEEQSAQMAAMAAELARVEDEYSALRKEMAQLETFRKAIVSMVDQHSGVSLAELEQSILGTIEADTENLEAEYEAAIDADTSSFMLDNDGESSVAPLPMHRQNHPEAYPTRQRNPGMSSTTTSMPLNLSPQRTVSRPRASTETTAKRPGSLQQPIDTRTRTQVARGGLSPVAHHSAPNSRRRTEALSDTSSGGLKVPKSGLTDSLRSKRNTISSSRSIYPNTSPSTAKAEKRHSNISPLSPRVRAVTSRVAGASTSFTSGSTPSTSPRQPLTTGINASAASLSATMATRTARQQQQKEYSLSVRKSMTQLATGNSGASSLSSSQNQRQRRQQNNSSDTSLGLQRDQSSRQSNGNSQVVVAGKRAHRSSTGAAMTLNDISPTLQRHDEEKNGAGHHKVSSHLNSRYTSQHHHHHFHSQDEHPGDDEPHLSSTVNNHTRTRSGTNTSTRSLHQSHKSEVDYVRDHEGYKSSSRLEEESSTRHRQNLNQSHDGKAVEWSSGITKTIDSRQQGNGGVDANAFTMLYKEIRDSMDASSFGLFARVVAAFNEGEKTTEETLLEVGKIVKNRTLNQRFQELIHQAIAEKENQLENDGGNETMMEGDITLDVDLSLLMMDNSHYNANDSREDEVSVLVQENLTESAGIKEEEEEEEDEEKENFGDDPEECLVDAMGAIGAMGLLAEPEEVLKEDEGALVELVNENGHAGMEDKNGSMKRISRLYSQKQTL